MKKYADLRFDFSVIWQCISGFLIIEFRRKIRDSESLRFLGANHEHVEGTGIRTIIKI